jgi:hypothetical protein
MGKSVLAMAICALAAVSGCRPAGGIEAAAPAPAAIAPNPALTVETFLHMKQFVLAKGDRRTYSSMYNDNPHFAFSDMDVYLNPEGGQRNINCDPALSDFDEIVIRTRNMGYYYVKRAPEGRPGLLVTKPNRFPKKPAPASGPAIDAEVDALFRQALAEIERKGGPRPDDAARQEVLP